MNHEGGCQQLVEHPPTRGYLPCNRPCEYVFPKKLRDAGAPLRTYKFCSAHRHMRRVYGPTDPRSMQPVKDKRRGEAKTV